MPRITKISPDCKARLTEAANRAVDTGLVLEEVAEDLEAVVEHLRRLVRSLVELSRAAQRGGHV